MNAWKILLGTGALLLCSCMADGDASSVGPDPFPRPIGPKIIPMESRTSILSTFRFVELDPQGIKTLSLDTLKLRVEARVGGTFTYSFENPAQGLILLWRDAYPMPIESVGVYVVGTFDQGVDTPGDTLFWLPQKPGEWTEKTWQFGDRKMEVVDADTAFYSEVVFPREPNRHGFQRHPTALFRETRVDSLDSSETVTYYHFRMGGGLVGMERYVDGRLRATGSIREFRIW